MRLPSRRLVLTLGLAHAAAFAGGMLVALSLTRDLPGIDRLDVLNLPKQTVLHARDGAVLHVFAEQKRIPVTLDEVSPWYLKALVATEDPRFREHIGVDLIAVARAALATVKAMEIGVEGASTITMQLAKLQFLTPKKTVSRKIQEAILATQIERTYSKEEILAFYVNRIYLGHGMYGVEAAARHYFGKSASEVTLGEAALLAGLTQMPERLTPVRHPERAARRRNYVLARMVAEEMIEARLGDEAAASELLIHDAVPSQPLGAYFVEEVRRLVARRFGENALYREGLEVETTLDPAMQRAAERAVRSGLDAYGRRHDQLPEPRPLPGDADPATWRHASWLSPMRPGDIVPALVVGVEGAGAEIAIGATRLELGRSAYRWTKRRSAAGLFAPDHVVDVVVGKVDEAGAPTEVELASAPTPQAALVAMDIVTGEVRALVGGTDFEASEFDRAMQARRQAGSAFKPFIYAAALELGYLPASRIFDGPVVLVDRGLSEPYQPENFERDYEGLVTLRHSLEHSRNIPTVRLLDDIGYAPAVDISRRLGIATDLKPYPSLALGAFEVKLSDLVAAYAAFANGGVLVRPALVTSVRHPDRQREWVPDDASEEVITPDVASMMSSMLQGVVLRGTGRQALSLGRPVAGKTGTTDDYTDAWFVGFTPDLAIGVWVGHDDNTTLGKRETGARAALPIWSQFVEESLAGQPVQEFQRPPGVSRVLLDHATGLTASRAIGCRPVVRDLVPTAHDEIPGCSWQEHVRSALPWPLQQFDVDDRGDLGIPPAALARLVTWAPDRLQLVAGGRRLAYRWNGRTGGIGLAWGPDSFASYLAALPAAAETRREIEEGRRRHAEEHPGGPDETEEVPLPPELRLSRDGLPADVVKVNRSGAARAPLGGRAAAEIRGARPAVAGP